MRLIILGLLGLGLTQPAMAQTFKVVDPALEKDLPVLTEAYTGEFASRTVNFGPDDVTPRYINRLVLEDSPYLRQHAHNPVNWHPWGPESLAKAEEEGKPIFLSIGYATCHWCHVMEHESFDDEFTARQINARFIPIKVDREQHPDVDELYMTALQMMADSAGWPLTGFLMPDGRPFYVDSYMRPNAVQGVTHQVARLWREDRQALEQFATDLSGAVEGYMTAQIEADAVGLEDARRAAEILLSTTDPRDGGFGRSPKFPHEPEWIWLLDLAELEASDDLKSELSRALAGMQAGGIHDQVGGGFHRYSVDGQWTVPHFEKMLYNQAQLLEVFARASVLLQEPSFARTAHRTGDFVFRDMRDEDGLFSSGYDADSEGGEGHFYIWTPAEIAAVVGEDAALVNDLLGISQTQPNFEGESIPTMRMGVEDIRSLDRHLSALEVARRDREWPLLDTKRITAWNAQMISALAVGGTVLRRQDWRDAALESAERLWDLHWSEDLQQVHRFSLDGGRLSDTMGVLPDYSYTLFAFTQLYDLSGNDVWLERASVLAVVMQDLFWDEDLQVFVSSAAENERLFAKPVSTNDGAQFSGASMAALGLTALGRRLLDPSIELRAAEALAGLGGRALQGPTSHGSVWRATLRRDHPELALGGRATTAAGTVRAMLEGDKLHLNMAEGWHINSFTPRQDYLIPTTLSFEGEEQPVELNRPEAKLTELAFSDVPLETYEGDLVFDLRTPETEGARHLSLQVQACNDRQCLPPETLRFALHR